MSFIESNPRKMRRSDTLSNYYSDPIDELEENFKKILISLTVMEYNKKMLYDQYEVIPADEFKKQSQNIKEALTEVRKITERIDEFVPLNAGLDGHELHYRILQPRSMADGSN